MRQRLRVTISFLLTACGGGDPPGATDAGGADAGEICVGRDDGVLCGGGNICLRGACVPSTCGDGYVHTGEECDDGNTTSFDGCNADCTFTCRTHDECTDGDPCNGAETCGPDHTCVAGSPVADGTACATPEIGSGICLDGRCRDCEAAACGTTFPERDFVCASGAPPPCATTVPVRTGAERTVEEPETLPGATMTFVIDTLSFPRRMGGVVAGFNLDGLDSGPGTSGGANCEEVHPDYVSLLDPMHVGVDNAFQEILPVVEANVDSADCPGGVATGCVDAVIARQIAEGETLILIEISGVDDLVYDSSVRVRLFAGRVPDGSTLEVDADGRLLPGQSFDTLLMGEPVDGDIFEGRVRAIPTRLSITVTIGELVIPLEILSPEIRFDLGESGLQNGQLGGRILVDAVVAAFEAVMPGFDDVVRTILRGIADIAPSATDPRVCEGVSVGGIFTATTTMRAR